MNKPAKRSSALRALLEDYDTRRAFLAGDQTPAVELEPVVAGVEVQRIPGDPPAERGAIADRGVVLGQRFRVRDMRRREVDRPREREPRGELRDHFAVGLDAEPMERGREQNPDHRTLPHRLDELVVTALRDDFDLAGQLTLPTIHERPVGELRAVRALDCREENLLERAPVIRNDELRQAERQVDATPQVLHLLVVADLAKERSCPRFELGRRDELHLGTEELLVPLEHPTIVDLWLVQVIGAVRIHHLTCDRIGRNAPAVPVHQNHGRVFERDLGR